MKHAQWHMFLVFVHNLWYTNTLTCLYFIKLFEIFCASLQGPIPSKHTNTDTDPMLCLKWQQGCRATVYFADFQDVCLASCIQRSDRTQWPGLRGGSANKHTDLRKHRLSVGYMRYSDAIHAAYMLCVGVHRQDERGMDVSESEVLTCWIRFLWEK